MGVSISIPLEVSILISLVTIVISPLLSLMVSRAECSESNELMRNRLIRSTHYELPVLKPDPSIVTRCMQRGNVYWQTLQLAIPIRGSSMLLQSNVVRMDFESISELFMNSGS